MKAKLLSLLCAVALTSAFGETTYRLALRDEAGHFLGTDDSVSYYYRVYDLTQKKYLHDPTYRYEIKLIDGGTHNVEFVADLSSWDPDYRAKEGDELRLEIYDAKNDFAKIGTVDDLPRVSEGETEILTPMIMALPQPGVATRNPLDLVHQLADDGSAVYWALWCAEAEGDFGGGWSEEAERKWQVGCDPYDGALSKAEVVAALTDAGYPDLSRPDSFDCDLQVSDEGVITACLTSAPGHVYTIWKEKAGVISILATEVVRVTSEKTSGELTLTAALPTEELGSCLVKLTIDGYLINSSPFSPRPLGVTVNGVDVVEGSGDGWNYDKVRLTLSEPGSYVLSGTNVDNRVSVLVATDATITLDNLVLTTSASPFVIETNRTVVVGLKGESTLRATGTDRAALFVDRHSSLKITSSTASTDEVPILRAFGAENGAGIGCGKWEMMGDIEIAGGMIEANGGRRAAGIGAGWGGGAGDDTPITPKRATIVISGGTVKAGTAVSTMSSDIGTANQSWPVNVIITGGSVMASKISLDPKNDSDKRIYRVTIDGLASTEPIALGALPAGYGTNDIHAVDGKIVVWLPSGRYVFSVDGVPYEATVNGKDTTAQSYDLMAVIRMDEDCHAIVEPSESIEGCSYSVIASETLDFKDTAILPIGRIEDPKYRFFRVRVSAK